jgi:Tfp pilus assembly protein PilF
MDPKSVEAYTNLAAVYSEQNKNEEALKFYDTILEIEPENNEAIENRNILLDLMKKKK